VGVIVAVSTADANPLAAFHELASASNMPAPLSALDHYDADIPRYFVLLHDVGGAAAGGLRARRRDAGAGGDGGALTLPLFDPAVVMRDLRTYFPPACCFLLPINSLGATAASLADTQPDVWGPHLAGCPPLFASTVERLAAAPLRATVPGVDEAAAAAGRAADADAGAGAGAAGSAYARLDVRQKASLWT
jgi:hypothetical protein